MSSNILRAQKLLWQAALLCVLVPEWMYGQGSIMPAEGNLISVGHLQSLASLSPVCPIAPQPFPGAKQRRLYALSPA